MSEKHKYSFKQMKTYYLDDNAEKQYKSLSELIKSEPVKVGDTVCIADMFIVNVKNFVNLSIIIEALEEHVEDSTDYCVYDVFNVPEKDFPKIEKQIAEILSPYAKEQELEFCDEITDYVLTEKDFEDEQNA